MNGEITEGLIRYYAKKKGISFEQAKYELENTYGYEDSDDEIDMTMKNLIEDISIFKPNYVSCPINPFNFNYDFLQSTSIFQCA